MESPEEELVGEAGVGPVDRQEEVTKEAMVVTKCYTITFTTGVINYSTTPYKASMHWIH